MSSIAFAVTLAATLLATPVARRAALRLGWVDRPSERKLHSAPVPYLGGLAIVVAFSLAVVGGASVWNLHIPLPSAVAIIGGGLLLSGMGLVDDLKVVPGWIKVPLELGLGSALYLTGSRAELFGFWPLDFVLTVGWVIGITNAVNYLDNMDGLSAGIVAIAAGMFTILAELSGQVLVGGLSASVAGCALGFLWYNRPPAKIYMGDAGSLFFGFLLASLGLELRFDNITRVTFFVPIAVMAVPITDALLVSVSRVMRGLSPIHPGKDHISHRLAALGLPPERAVPLLWFASAACGWLGVTIAQADQSTAYMLIGWMMVVASVLGAMLLRVEI